MGSSRQNHAENIKSCQLAERVNILLEYHVVDILDDICSVDLVVVRILPVSLLEQER